MWLYKPNFQCTDNAVWKAPSLMEDYTFAEWKLCDTHKQMAVEGYQRLDLPDDIKASLAESWQAI